MSFNSHRSWQITLTLLLIGSSLLTVSSPRSTSSLHHQISILCNNNSNSSKWWCSRQNFLLVTILKECGQMLVVCMACRNKLVKFNNPCSTVDLRRQTYRCCLNSFRSSIYTIPPTNNLSQWVVADSFKSNLNTCIVVAYNTSQHKEASSMLQLHRVMALRTLLILIRWRSDRGGRWLHPSHFFSLAHRLTLSTNSRLWGPRAVILAARLIAKHTTPLI